MRVRDVRGVAFTADSVTPMVRFLSDAFDLILNPVI